MDVDNNDTKRDAEMKDDTVTMASQSMGKVDPKNVGEVLAVNLDWRKKIYGDCEREADPEGMANGTATPKRIAFIGEGKGRHTAIAACFSALYPKNASAVQVVNGTYRLTEKTFLLKISEAEPPSKRYSAVVLVVNPNDDVSDIGGLVSAWKDAGKALQRMTAKAFP